MLHAAVGCDARDEARVMFQRVLAAWAVDALSLRRRGLDRPCSRDGRAADVARLAAPSALRTPSRSARRD